MLPFGVILVIRTNADTDGAVAVLGDPIAETFLPIDHPFSHTDDVGLVVNICRGWSIGDSLDRAALCAALAGVAELLDAKWDRLVVRQRQVGVDFAQPYAGAKLITVTTQWGDLLGANHQLTTTFVRLAVL